jgi:hypothetical protein
MMVRRMLLVAGVSLVLSGHAATAGDDPTTRWIGTWSGKVTAKGCASDGKSTLALDVALSSERTLRSNGDLLVEGLGDLDWQVDGKNLAITREGMSASLKVSGKSAKLALKTDGGCTVKGTLKRVTSGMPACDQVRALATIKAQCSTLPSESRGETLAGVDADWKAWSKLKGKKKKTQAAACKAQVETLTTEVDACMGVSLASSTGLADCDALIGAYQQLAQCQALPQDTRDAMGQAIEAMRQGWGDISKMDDATKRAMNDGCKQGADAIRQSISATGC